MPSFPIWRSPWLLRAVWVGLPVLIGPSLADALGDRSRAVQVVASALAWSLWALTLAATLVPRSVTLTVIRLTVPGAFTCAVWSAIGAGRAGWAALGVASGAIAVLVAAGPGVADSFVDGSSYGSERRVALRAPLAVLLGPAPLAWSIAAGVVVGGPMLLTVENWIAGTLVIALGAPVATLAVRQVHLLSRRWLVFVPAGVVVHDPLTLTEPILLQRHLVAQVGPALLESATSEAVVDATGGALGLALELRSREPFSVGVRRGRQRVERDGVVAMLVTPTRPAATMAIAADHRLPVG